MQNLLIVDPATIVKGGSGSGNFGHAGRPGEVGGSAPAGSAPAGSDTDLQFPDAQELEQAEWFDISDNTSAARIWKVTTRDGRNWFVKQPSLDFYKVDYEEIPNELSAYLIGKSLGLPVLPVDYVFAGTDFLEQKLDDNGQPAILLSPWLDNCKTHYDTFRRAGGDDGRAMFPMADRVRFSLFDFIIKNADRHESNLIFDENGDPVLIDHGLSFNNRDDLAFGKPFYWEDAAGEKITESTMAWLADGIAKAKKQATPRTAFRVDFAERRLDTIRRVFDEMVANGETTYWWDVRDRLGSLYNDSTT